MTILKLKAFFRTGIDGDVGMTSISQSTVNQRLYATLTGTELRRSGAEWENQTVDIYYGFCHNRRTFRTDTQVGFPYARRPRTIQVPLRTRAVPTDSLHVAVSPFASFADHRACKIMPVTVRHYDDFDLQLRPAQDGAYEAAVLRSPAGEARQAFSLSPSPAEVAAQLPAVEMAIAMAGDAGVADAIRFGAMLFSSLFTGKLLQLYDQSLSHVRSRGRDLRIGLRVLDDALLAALPWELLYDTREQRFIALQPDVVLTRTAEAQQPIKDLAVTPPLRVLAMAAQPSDLAALDLERERRHLAHSLARLGDGVELHWVDGQNWRALHDALQRGEWHVFHFLGHGLFDRTEGAGALAFAGDDGLAELHSAEELSLLLGDHDTLRLVVLNACEGAQGGGSQMDAGIAQLLVRAGVPAVVAMQAPVAESHAAELTRSFYGALGNGLAIDAAFAEARKALSLAAPGALAWAVPVLVMRSGQIGSIGSANRGSWLAIGGVLLSAIILAVVLMIGWPGFVAQWGVVRLPDGEFSVAISPFLVAAGDLASADSHQTPSGDEIARQISKYLKSLEPELTSATDLVIRFYGPEDRIPATAGNVAGQTAGDLGAEMLIFGEVNWNRGVDTWEVTPKFYVADTGIELAYELLGEHALGVPIPYEAGSTGMASVFNREMKQRLDVLMQMIRALSLLLKPSETGVEQAIIILEELGSQSEWIDETENVGQDIYYLILGNAYLAASNFVSDNPEGEREMLYRSKQTLLKAKDFGTNNPRIENALGAVIYKLAFPPSDSQEDECAWDWRLLAEAEARHAAALDAPAENKPEFGEVDQRARLGIATIYFVRGFCSRDATDHHFDETQQLLADTPNDMSEVTQMRPDVLFNATRGQVLLAMIAYVRFAFGEGQHFLDESLDHFQAASEFFEANRSQLAANDADGWLPYYLDALCYAEQGDVALLVLREFSQRYPEPENMAQAVSDKLSNWEECINEVSN